MRVKRKTGVQVLPKGMYKIEKHIPLPATIGNGFHALRKYPWYEMEKGDSFFVPKKPPSYVKNAATKVMKEHKDKKFVFQSEAAGTRCWRTE